MRRLQSSIIWLTVVFILWNAWYYLWFNHGWPGATRTLIHLKNADGEAAYDAMSDEMLLLVTIVCGLVCSWLRYGRSTLQAVAFSPAASKTLQPPIAPTP